MAGLNREPEITNVFIYNPIELKFKILTDVSSLITDDMKLKTNAEYMTGLWPQVRILSLKLTFLFTNRLSLIFKSEVTHICFVIELMSGF